VQITRLADRCGIIGFAYFTRGDINDIPVPVTIESHGALRFIFEVLKRDPYQLAAQFELWAVARAKGSLLPWIVSRRY
jgi:hypothetical protein